jgi:hypothetical protein
MLDPLARIQQLFNLIPNVLEVRTCLSIRRLRNRRASLTLHGTQLRSEQ